MEVSNQKLVYVLPKYFEGEDGHFNHVYNFLKRLEEKDVDLHVLIEKSVGTPPFKHYTIIKRSFMPLRVLETLKALFRLRRGGFKTFYVHCTTLACILTSIVTRLTNAKTFFWHCGMSHLFFKKFGQKHWLRNKLYDDWSLKLSLAWCDHLVTGNERMKQYYRDYFLVPKSKTIVLPNEIDLSRFEYKPRTYIGDTPRILFVHRMTERKGAHYIVPIAKLVLKERPQAKFVIVGDGDYLDTLRKEVALYKLQDSFIIKGKVPNNRIQEEFYNADVYIMPSQEEGFPRVLLEAMACGTPFVAFDVGGVRDIVCPLNQDQIVKADDITTFSQRILDLIGMEDESRLGIINANYQWVQQYDQPIVLQRFLEVMQN